MKKHNEELERSKVHIITLISFFTGFAQAMLIYVMSYYFKLASGTEDVGIFYLISYGILLVLLLNLHKIIKAIGKSQAYFFSVLLCLVSLSVLIFTKPSFLGIFFLLAYIVAIMTAWTLLDIILESFSTDSMSGRIRGMHLTIVNAGYLAGPFLSTKIYEHFDFRGVFIFLLILNSLILVVGLLGIRNVNHKFNIKLSVSELIKKVCCKSDLMKIYYIAFCLDFFYALMVIYTSIYLLDQGISWSQIGIIFTIMLVPFVILQYPIGRIADKQMGEKEMIIFALLFMGVSSAIVYFTKTSNIWIWAIILFSTRVGAAMVEILRDSYFYKRIDGSNVDMINFFRTSVPVGYMVAAGISFPLLIIFPVKIVFLIVAIVSISGLYPAFRLVDNKCEKECKGKLELKKA